jgi:hypothetical protein
MPTLHDTRSTISAVAFSRSPVPPGRPVKWLAHKFITSAGKKPKPLRGGQHVKRSTQRWRESARGRGEVVVLVGGGGRGVKQHNFF